MYVTSFLSQETGGLDFIGDIHGQFEKLTGLLASLGYERIGQHGFRHPEGRRVVFLGDYIDRGPRIRDTLQAVRAMVDSGDALAIMGNHEFNAITFATPDPRGGYLRPHSKKNVDQHSATLAQFENARDEWQDWLAWFKTLPMWLDFGGIRSVHACWDQICMDILADGDLCDSKFLEQCATERTREFAALETVLKGPEIPLPTGVNFSDKQGIVRLKIRSRWWDLTQSQALTFGDLAMPPGSLECEQAVEPSHLSQFPNYTESVPVLFGHYWLPPDTDRVPLADNIGCLDFSAGLTGPLVAYRWDGESCLQAKHFVECS